jgi:hypothetical protein
MRVDKRFDFDLITSSNVNQISRQFRQAAHQLMSMRRWVHVEVMSQKILNRKVTRFEFVVEVWERYMIDLKSFFDQIRLFVFFANVMRNIQQSFRAVVNAFFSSFVEVSLTVLRLIEIRSRRTISFFFRRTSMMKTSILTYKDFECVAMCFELFS